MVKKTSVMSLIRKKIKTLDLRELSPDEFKKYQVKLLETLVYFRDFCKEHNLKFYLSGGTCLGALRHKGFIPWDDDVDVMMPREDYEKLPVLWEKYADKTKFSCSRTTRDQCVSFPMTVVRNENTTLVFDHSVDLDISHGVKIDVEYCDSVPENKFIASINRILAAIMALYRTQRIPRQTKKSKKIVATILLVLIPFKSWRWKISCWCQKQIVKYNDIQTEFIRYGSEKPLKRSWYSGIVYLDFEGEKMPVPSGYEEMLTVKYKNYMQLPPESARYPKTNNVVFMDLDNSYKKYKGIYYCKK